ncbi:MAG: lantibiotic dehydratase [Pseudosphingobacterium sp.]|nr:lantibiotic dehydratase [Pseudosphingobacterium sp.]
MARLISGLRDESAINRLLSGLADDPGIREALYLASPGFVRQLTKEKQEGELTDRTLATLYKYIIRMSTRATPFGKFAGIATGQIHGHSTKLTLNGKNETFVRLDMQLIGKIAMLVQGRGDLRKSLIFLPNNTLYKVTDHYRYYEYRDHDGPDKYFLSKIRSSQALTLVIEKAESGLKYSELTALLTDKGAGEKAACEFIDKLISLQVLVSDLIPPLTGNSFERKFNTKLSESGQEGACLASLLQKVREEYHAAFQKDMPTGNLPELPEFLKGQIKHPFQADLKIGTHEASIGESLMETILSEINEVLCLGHAGIPEDLRDFTNRFIQRYGDREIDLTLALDPVLGINYGLKENHRPQTDPVLKDMTFRKRKEQAGKLPLIREAIQAIMKEHPQLCHRPVDLHAENFRHFFDTSNLKHIPPSFYVIGNLLQPCPGEIDKNNFLFNVIGIGGVSALPLLARFAYMEKDLQERLMEIAAHDEKCMEDAVIAEIVHLPDYRSGNILQRPSLFHYEIPVNANSSLPKETTIPVSDLTIREKGGRLHLRSKRLNRTVIPRLSNAHNFNSGMILYRFLADFQQVGWSPGWRWDWNDHSDLCFLPRIQYKHLILERARWILPADLYPSLKHLNRALIPEYLLAHFGLPAKVALAEGDNELYLDLENPYGISLLLEKLKKGKVLLFEVMHPGDSPLRDQTGRHYANEVIIPLKSGNRPAPTDIREITGPAILKRSFFPGGEWTYLKIYCSQGFSDTLICGPLAKLKERLSQMAIIKKWFFIRYSDPEPHLRIRFKTDQSQSSFALSAILQLTHDLFSSYTDSGLVSSIQLDTYHRELQRYGERYMEYCESLFQLQSEFVLGYLDISQPPESEDFSLWLAAVSGIDMNLKLHGLSLQARTGFAREMYNSFLKEFEGEKGICIRLNEKYRSVKRTLEQFSKGTFATSRHAAISDLLKQTFSTQHRIMQGELIDREQLPDFFFKSTLPSICHMYINRLFAANQRECELITYFFLTKLYEYQKAIHKASLLYFQ